METDKRYFRLHHHYLLVFSTGIIYLVVMPKMENGIYQNHSKSWQKSVSTCIKILINQYYGWLSVLMKRGDANTSLCVCLHVSIYSCIFNQ